MTKNRSTFKIITSKFNIALIRMDNKYYVVNYSNSLNQVYSIIPSDCPPEFGQWMAEFSDWGVAYVATGRCKSNAYKWFKKITETDEDFDYIRT